jgi:hypothetical protein
MIWFHHAGRRRYLLWFVRFLLYRVNCCGGKGLALPVQRWSTIAMSKPFLPRLVNNSITSCFAVDRKPTKVFLNAQYTYTYSPYISLYYYSSIVYKHPCVYVCCFPDVCYRFSLMFLTNPIISLFHLHTYKKKQKTTYIISFISFLIDRRCLRLSLLLVSVRMPPLFPVYI